MAYSFLYATYVATMAHAIFGADNNATWLICVQRPRISFPKRTTHLKPCGAPLVLDKEDEFLEVTPDTKGTEDSDPTNACSLKLWLCCRGSNRNHAYVPYANGNTVQFTHFVHEFFNGNDEHV